MPEKPDKYRDYGAPQDEETEKQKAEEDKKTDGADLYGIDTPYEDQLTKDEKIEMPDQQRVQDEEDELKYRRPK